MDAALSAADDQAFLELIFAVDALQKGRLEVAAPVLRGNYPPSTVGAGFDAKGRIHEWEMETLANELLAQPYSHFVSRFGSPRLDCHNFDTLAYVTSILRQLENIEYAVFEVDVLREMPRIASRQFEWQRGFFNKTSAYRSAYLFNGPVCGERLIAKTGHNFDELSFASFGFYTVFNHFVRMESSLPMEHVGISDSLRDAVIELISAPLGDARASARKERSNWPWVAYRPSILRQKPCIRVGYGENLVICPLPDLIMERLSSGIFYDVAADDGAVRSEIGTRFEDYCAKILQESQSQVGFDREYAYKSKKGEIRSPDLLLGDRNERWALVECKATRMSFPARYSDVFENERGYDEISKAVFQIWRYVAHCRLNIAPDRLSPNCLGIVLTLDSWMQMGTDQTYKAIFSSARAMCAAKAPEISVQDQIAVVFCHIPEWETLVTGSSVSGMKRILQANSTGQFRGWLLSSIPKRKSDIRKYKFPFKDMQDVLPWWDRLTTRSRGEKR